MHLNDLNKKNTASKALKLNFDFSFDTSRLNRARTVEMLNRVNKLLREAKSNPKFHRSQNDPSYLKLVFMQQALSEHYHRTKSARIVVENTEVEKSQVILAAQDMIDSVQKMIEEVNDMLVKELPALTDSIQSEIGVNESGMFSQAANEALTALNKTLSQSKQTLQDAMNEMTGQGGSDMLGGMGTGGEEVAVTDIGAEEGPEGAELDMDQEDIDLPSPPEELEQPEERPTGGVGREKR